jgi:DNA-binding response OmpR family regulator/methylphosphotriester-DNA--protein-cysteine methyltransferase
MDLLFVEDEAAVANLYLPYFEKSGWRTHWVTTVGAGIAAVLQRSYDAVLLDLLLKEEGHPDGDGLDVLRAMRSHGLQAPVVICSSYGTERRAIGLGEEFGVVTVLAKPVDTRTLLMCLAAAAAAAAKTPHGPLSMARAALAALDMDGADAAGLCTSVLLRACGDRMLPLRPFALLGEEVAALSKTRRCDRARLDAAINRADAVRIANDREVDRILSVLAVSEIKGGRELARICEMSVKRIRQRLIDSTGHGIAWWRRISRVRRFVIELLSTGDHVDQCAFRAGYSNGPQASRDCQALLGMSPKQLRELASGLK